MTKMIQAISQRQGWPENVWGISWPGHPAMTGLLSKRCVLRGNLLQLTIGIA
jgi:hypothetical protein